MGARGVGEGTPSDLIAPGRRAWELDATKKHAECLVCSQDEESRLLTVCKTSRELVNAVLWE
jgi:hypothetical protein